MFRLPLRKSALFLVLVGIACAATSTHGWVLNGYRWPTGTDIVMHLQLNKTTPRLQDGNTSWNGSAADALRLWNAHLGLVKFVAAGPVGGAAPNDNINTVNFSSTVYGQAFGENTLAVTLYFSSGPTFTETDIIFNSAATWNSYRGPVQRSTRGTTHDLHRVALHEFGHALGLAHPDEHGQSDAHALMQSVISDVDHLTADDIAAAQSLYAPRITSSLSPATVPLAQHFNYWISANNHASSFSAEGLPPGLTLDAATGRIYGSPQRSGTYDVLVTAHGEFGSASTTLRFTVPAPRITSSSSAAGAQLGAFYQWHKIVADNSPTRFEADGLPPGLSVDQSTGLISGIPTVSGSFKVKLVAYGIHETATGDMYIQVFTPPPLADPHIGGFQLDISKLLADPARPRLYCGTYSGLAIIDTATMSIIKTIPGPVPRDFSISRDGRTLWVVWGGLAQLARVDLETLERLPDFITPVPVNVARHGLENRLYAAALDGEILQLDTLSGAVQRRFYPSVPLGWRTAFAELDLSPDGRALYVADSSHEQGAMQNSIGLARYDVSTEEPTLIQRVNIGAGHVWYVRAHPNGRALLVIPAATGSTHRLTAFAADNLSRITSTFETTGSLAELAFTPDGREICQLSSTYDGGSIDVLDAETLARKRSFGIKPEWGQAFLSDVAVDSTGTYIFAGTNAYPSPLRIYPAKPAPPKPVPPKSLLNVSSRVRAEQGGRSLIAGFILSGAEPKKVAVRAIGPSLPLAGRLGDPQVTLHDRSGNPIAANDNWNSTRNDVLRAGLAPSSEYESVVIATLEPGAYTARVGMPDGANGIAVVEAYDLDPESPSRLANISSRAYVDSGDNVLIAGFILGGDQSTRVIVRAIAPSLLDKGVPDALHDTTLDLHDGNGMKVASNDDWQTEQEQEIIDSTVPPTDPREAAIVRTLQPGNHTAIVRGKNGTSGVAVVEVYNLY